MVVATTKTRFLITDPNGDAFLTPFYEAKKVLVGHCKPIEFKGLWRDARHANGSVKQPQNGPCDSQRGEDTHPSLGVEVETWAFKSQLVVGHDTALDS